MEENYSLSVSQIKKSIKENSLILFVGAGISANSNLPTWGELIQSFREELDLPDDNSDLFPVNEKPGTGDSGFSFEPGE